jgi:hypothetical protein
MQGNMCVCVYVCVCNMLLNLGSKQYRSDNVSSLCSYLILFLIIHHHGTAQTRNIPPHRQSLDIVG